MSMVAVTAITLSQVVKGETVITGVLCKQYYTSASPADERKVLSLVKKYNRDAYTMMMKVRNFAGKYCGKPGNRFMVYAPSMKMNILKGALGTLVHESVHGYTSSAFYDEVGTFNKKSVLNGKTFVMFHFKDSYRYMSVYLPQKGMVHIPMIETFPSKKIVPLIRRKELHTNRFKTYVDSPSKYLGTQRDGIFGLLNEFHAYYHGFTVKEKIRYEEKPGSMASMVHSDEYLSFLEFKLFILAYLKYAEQHEPKIYRELMANHLFVETFIVIHDLFEKLHLGYAKRYENYKMVKGRAYQEKKMTFKGRTVMAQTDITEFITTLKALRDELALREYQDMMGRLRRI